MGAFMAVALILIGIAAFCLIMCLMSPRRGKPARVDEEAGAAKVVNPRPKNKATDLSSIVVSDSPKKVTAETERRVDGEAAARGGVSDGAEASARGPTSRGKKPVDIPTRVDEEAGAAKVVNSRPKNKATKSIVVSDSGKKVTAGTGHRVDGEAAARGGVSDGAVASARGPTSIDYAALKAATNKFSSSREVGRGKFGVVYKADLQDPYGVCAVKKLISQQPKKDLDAELATMSHVSHPNVVQLKGWCRHPNRCGREDLYLVYEYIPNFSLEEHLFGGGEKKLPLLSWANRNKIANGLVAGVAHLHTAGKNNNIVIHRDIKPPNIMLDEGFTPKLGDFGLARLAPDGKSMNTTANGGTYGYMAPEITPPSFEKASKESDVYSVGIVLLQIATGKTVSVPQLGSDIFLVSWVWKLLLTDNILVAVGTDQYDKLEAIRLLVVGLWCCHSEASRRPQMSEVLSVLNGGTRLPNVPLIPPEGYVANDLKMFTTSQIKEKIEALLNFEAPIPSTNLLLSLGESSNSSSSSNSKYCTPPTSMTSTERHAPAETMDKKGLQQIPE